MFEKMVRPSSTADTMDAKLSSVSIISDASRETSGAVDAHGHANVCRLQCRGVVDTVTGHRDDALVLLEGVDNPELMGWRNPCINGDLFDPPVERFIVHLIQLGSADRLLAFPEDSYLLGNGRGGDLMVPGDHDGLDARRFTYPDRIPDLVPRGSIMPTRPAKTISCSTVSNGMDASPFSFLYDRPMTRNACDASSSAVW